VVFLQLAAPTTLSDQCALSSSFTFLQSITQRNLVRQPQPADTSHGLFFPSAHQGSEVHSTRVLPSRYVPPSGFGYPLGGLLPPSPCRFCFTPAALMGFALRSLPLSKGIRAFPRGRTHLPFLPSVFPSPKLWAGPTGRGSWALTLPRVPGDQTGINSPTAGCSLGLCPSRVCWREPCSGLHPNSSHALLRMPTLRLPFAGAPESQSTLAWPRPPHRAGRVKRTRQPL